MSNFWEVFAATADRSSRNIAVEVQRSNGLERRTYKQLRDDAEAVARWLIAHGVAAGDRCAILADNDARWCVVYLGALRIGAVAVPLDTNYSAAQVATVLSAAGARLLFAGPRLLAVAHEATAATATPVVAMYADAAPGISASVDTIVAAGVTRPLPPCPATAGAAAVILYTSGTTSDPKGVVLTHGNLAAERDAAFAVVDVSERDAVLGVLPLFHSLAQMANLLLPLAVGARVVFLETLNTAELLKALAERQVTIFVCVPQFFYLIHERVSAEARKGGVLKHAVFRWLVAATRSLRGVGINLGPTVFARVHKVLGGNIRLLVTGGSKFDPAIGRDLYGLGFTILQAYGLTETSGAATITDPGDAHLDTVGRVLPGNELRVLPAEGDAEDGEIAIRGPIVMQGYFNRPDATAEAMREGWFLTGDLGRLDGGGRLTITGRKKEIIVLASGKNIYPEEIEAQYRKSAIVKDVCVIGVARPGEPTSERLHAIVVPDADVLKSRRIANAGDLLRFEMEGLGAGLPPHKRVLGYDMWFEPLPRTTTGKLRRHEIRRRFLAQQADKDAASSRPRSAAEQEWHDDPHVAAAMALVHLRTKAAESIGPESNLELDLGLDSMERVELLTQLEQRFAVKVPEATRHEIGTIGALIESVRPAGACTGDGRVDVAWATLLRDLPPTNDPVLGRMLDPRPIAAPAIWGLLRAFRVVTARVEVTGLEHLPAHGPFLLCPNHQGYFDPFLLCGVLPFATVRDMFVVGAAEYFNSPVMAWIARQINLVPVNPDDSLVSAMRAGAFGLTHGKVLLLFPEGERSIDGSVKRFKKGAPILARHLAVPIVPVAIRGVFELWPRTRGINWKLMFRLGGHRVRIRLGSPLTVRQEESDAEAAERLRHSVDHLWQRI